MNEEEIREYIRAKNNPVSNCVGLSRYFIGRHKVLPVYLTLHFEREFNSKMCELEKLKEQLEKSEKSRKEAIEYVKKRNFDNAEILVDMECEYCYDDDFKDCLLNILDIDKGE